MTTKTSEKCGSVKASHKLTASAIAVKTSIKSGAGTEIPIKIKHNL